MDKLLNEFTVNRPIEETWTVLTDVERIAPCMPGAQLQEIEGDVYRGLVKIKLGAISTSFKGQASFTERDDAAHRAVLKAEGRDTGGKGNADALITATLESVSAEVTKCVVTTDLRVTGKVAQFGRGIMADVSKKLMGQFATNLNTMLDEQGSTNGDTAAPEVATAEAAAPAAPAAAEMAASATTNGTAASAPTVRKIEGPAAEPVELSGLAGGAILKRVLPLIAGIALLAFVLRRLRK
ncbi:MAG: SRPBCC family protein [Ilumatobacteraceae bacterium]